MKLFLLNKIRTGSYLSGIYAPHCQMFHGVELSRGGDTDVVPYHLGMALLHPVHLHKNVFNMAEILMPRITLVISERVKISLEKLPHISFVQVVFERLFSFPYVPHD